MPRFPRRRKARISVKKVDRKVNKLIKAIEVKVGHGIETDQILDTNQGVIINGLFRGNNSDQRDGTKVTMKKVIIKYRLKAILNQISGSDTTQNPWTAQATSLNCRVLLVLNRQNNLQSTFTVAEILQQSQNQTQMQISQYNYDFVDLLKDKKKYKILYDRMEHLVGNQMSGDFKRTIKRSFNMNIAFNDQNGGDGGDIIKNKLELIFFPQTFNSIEASVSSSMFFTDS